MIYLNSNMTSSEHLEACRPLLDLIGIPTDWIESLIDNESGIQDARDVIVNLEEARSGLPDEDCLEDVIDLARSAGVDKDLIEALELKQTDLAAGYAREELDKAITVLSGL